MIARIDGCIHLIDEWDIFEGSDFSDLQDLLFRLLREQIDGGDSYAAILLHRLLWLMKPSGPQLERMCVNLRSEECSDVSDGFAEKGGRDAE